MQHVSNVQFNNDVCVNVHLGVLVCVERNNCFKNYF